MGKIIEYKRGLELVTSVSLGIKFCLEILFSVIGHLGNFDDLIRSGFSVITKNTFANLCNPIQYVIIIPVSSGLLIYKIDYLENKRRFLDDIKSIFHKL